MWISIASVPYSRLNDSRNVFAGSLPGLRIGQNPAPRRSATAPPRMNPRLSMPTTMSMPAPANGAERLSMAILNPSGSRRSVVMS